MKIAANDFSAAFRLWHNGRPRSFQRIHYDMVGDFVYLPKAGADDSTLFEFMHEWTHSQLSAGLHGRVLLNLNRLTACVEPVLFAYLDGVLERALPNTQFPFKYLDARAQQVLDRHAKQLRSAWTRLYDVAEFRESLYVFDELNYRRTQLLRVWHDLHEGLATHTVISLCCSELDDPADWVGTACRYLAGIVTGEYSHKLREQLREMGEYEQRRIERNVFPQPYARGLRAAMRLTPPGKDFDIVWAAALLAMHFQYSNCPLLDMDRAEFDLWSATYATRFERLSYHSKEIGELNELLGHPLVDPLPKIRAILTIVDSQASPGESFGKWLTTEIWASKLFQRFLAAVEVKIDDMPEFQALQTRLNEDVNIDFRIREFKNPNVIDDEGRIVCNPVDRAPNVANAFLIAFTIARTERLTRWFRQK